TIKQEIKNIFKAKFSDYEELESDPYIAVIEAIAYRELLLRARINDSVLSMLIPYASGSDLDNIVALYGVERLKGAKPRATVKFELTIELANNVTIPANTLFRSNKGEIARLVYDVTIEANKKIAEGTLELDEYVKESTVKTEYVQNPQPFVFNIKQTTSYTNGADAESDEKFRERAILSLERFSTAGSINAYRYYATINTNIEEVGVAGEYPAGVVKIYLRTVNNLDLNEEKDLIKDVLTALNKEDVRPLTDKVEVYMSTRKTLTVSATIGLLDLGRQSEINNKIEATKQRFALGEDVNLSYLYKILHQEGVYRADITAMKIDDNDAEVENQPALNNEFYDIVWDINYEEAQW
ncbi:MAG: baseplate J/gp47 family protein, partial [Campylobacteraceae bacterium]|nr:baseplate J/gp47 family protein [Campylobacteraceae bacterium]